MRPPQIMNDVVAVAKVQGLRPMIDGRYKYIWGSYRNWVKKHVLKDSKMLFVAAGHPRTESKLIRVSGCLKVEL